MNQIIIPTTLMRGGTSKCWVFEREVLNNQPLSMDDILLRSFGSPDIRQLDGVGGGTSTTSKAVILHPLHGKEIDGQAFDVNYLFAQVGIDEPKVDWGSNCGNCSAVVAIYAIKQGWVTPTDGVTSVRVYNENTGQAIVQQVATPNGQITTETTPMVGSVYDGTLVNIGFFDPAGKTTGKLFPTDNHADTIAINGTDYTVTLVDAGAPCVYVSADDFGLNGKSRDEWTSVINDKLDLLDQIRRLSAVKMGMADTPELAEKAVPKLGVIGKSLENADLCVQMLSMGKPHPAMPVTGSVALTLSAQFDGTTASQILGKSNQTGVTLDTPSGVIETFASTLDDKPVVGVSRTARTIAQAELYVPTSPKPTEVV